MSNSLREKLLGLGFKAPEPEPKPERPAKSGPNPERQGRTGRPAKPGEQRNAGGHRKPGGDARPAGKPSEGRRDGRKATDGKPRRPDARPARPRSQSEIDLGKAYAIRAQKEKEERIEAERLKQEEARLRREAKAKLAELVKDKGLNDKAAEIARHFPYGGKIKRIHVTAEQLRQLNAGELGVLQMDGRYLLVTAAVLDEAEKVFAPAVALRVDPNAPAGEDPYADPQYQVPDDLVW
jgi:uncharacterized protein YaiL (DUF2058 family)